MAYALDLRKRAVDFVKDGGSKAEAARRFKVSLRCVSDWVRRSDLKPRRPPEGHNRFFDWSELERDVCERPDATLKETCLPCLPTGRRQAGALLFGVNPSTICRALKIRGITVKKSLRYPERDPGKRMKYLRNLRKLLEQTKPSLVVYVDESGFESDSFRRRGWAPKGQKLHGERKGKPGRRTNLLAAFTDGELIAPALFEGGL